MTGRAPALIVAGFLLAAAILAEEEPLRIGRITVTSLDVFAPEEAERGWVYRTANALHVGTRPDTIRKFLLFEEGDSYDPTVLAQTERNLRQLDFLKSAQVKAGKPHDGVVDVEVVTQDAWTTEIALSAGSAGGETRWGVGLVEGNLLGRGKQLALSYVDGFERTDRRIEFRDPALFGSYWSASLLYADNSDGGQRRVRVFKPFTSVLDRLAAEALWDDHRLEQRMYADGEIVSEFAHHQEIANLSAGTSISSSSSSAQRLSAGVRFVKDLFAPVAGAPDAGLPENREFRYVYVGFESISNDYLSLPFVNRDLRVEDFNLGRRVAVSVGLSPKAFGVPATTAAVAGALEQGWRLPGAAFAKVSAAFETRVDGGLQNAILTTTGSVVIPWRSGLAQTTVARAVFQKGWNLDGDVQFFADGDHGLRGYRLYAFEGDRRFILNVEHRVFGGFEVLQLFTLGAAVFVDTGTAVPPGTPLNVAAFKTDAGAGLRVGIARAARNTVLRLDFAYAFDPDPQGRRGWLVSFSSGQAF
jgi:hypothetical protein